MPQYSFTDPDPEELRDAAAYVHSNFGADVVSKASEELLLRLRQLPPRRRGGLRNDLGMPQAFGLESAPPAATVIVELENQPVPLQVKDVPVSPEHWKAVFRDALLVESLENMLQNNRLEQRATEVKKASEAFEESCRAVSQTLENSATPASFGKESSEETVEKCWLNGTLRTSVDGNGLAEIVADNSISHIDVPRRLHLDDPLTFVEPENVVGIEEILELGQCIGAPTWRRERQKTGQGVIVAVIDTEVDVTHPGLEGRIEHKKDFTKEGWGTPDAHGTAVAGIIAGDGEVIGVAPGATIYNYKVIATDPSQSADDFGGALAIQQALDDGVDIANCSWGSGPAVDGTSREARACDAAWTLGMTIIKSAGNRGSRLNTMTTPADAEGVIVVGATDVNGALIPNYSSRGFSSNNKGPHLLAPGGDVSMGLKSCTVGGGFGFCGMGTSFAAPHVAGLVALLLELRPNLTPDELRAALLSTCIVLGRGSEHEGKGLVNITRL